MGALSFSKGLEGCILLKLLRNLHLQRDIKSKEPGGLLVYHHILEKLWKKELRKGVRNL